jgi:hypothetical protein
MRLNATTGPRTVSLECRECWRCRQVYHRRLSRGRESAARRDSRARCRRASARAPRRAPGKEWAVSARARTWAASQVAAVREAAPPRAGGRGGTLSPDTRDSFRSTPRTPLRHRSTMGRDSTRRSRNRRKLPRRTGRGRLAPPTFARSLGDGSERRRCMSSPAARSRPKRPIPRWRALRTRRSDAWAISQKSGPRGPDR